ncbi:MAG: hypothetical protein ACYTEQ_09565 [Planctomycetota bacterium]
MVYLLTACVRTLDVTNPAATALRRGRWKDMSGFHYGTYLTSCLCRSVIPPQWTELHMTGRAWLQASLLGFL